MTADKDRAAREAAAAVDTVLDQMPAPGSTPNAADVLAANTQVRAAAQLGVTGQDIRAHLRDR